MPEDTRRYVDQRYARSKEITNFSDGYPVMMIGQASLDDLNSRMERALPMNRFRPNIVFTGGEPYEEDSVEQFTLSSIEFFCAKPSFRCVVTTIDQETAAKGKEPLQTLAGYRMENNQIYFGQNLLHVGEGIIHTGDVLEVKKEKIKHF